MTTVDSTENLKLRFDQLQQKQQEKLAQRKQKKTAEKTNKGVKETVKIVTFGVDDNLDLKLSEPDPNNGSIYSEELVLHLNDQIREMKDENGRLYKLLSERDFELRKLHKKLETATITGVPPGGIAAEAASSKIVELSKKVRELTAELEAERTKVKQLARKCVDLQKESQAEANTTSPTSGNSTYRRKEQFSSPGEDDTKTLQDKLRQTELKVTEYRNQSQALKQELRLAQKVLVQEVGEGSTVQSLMATSSGWRGRAQQIITLQKKVNELKSQLGKQQRSTSAGTSDLDDELFGTSMNRSTKRMSAIEQHKEQIRKAEKERREARERMAAELKALEQDHEALKEKLEAAKARNKVLQTESKASKQQIETLLEKGRHDDELIEALFKQQGKLKSMLDETTSGQRQAENNRQEALTQLSQRSQQENNIIDQLQRIVDEKEIRIRTLQEQLQHMQNAGMQQNHVTFEWGPSSNRGCESRQEMMTPQAPSAAWTSPPPPLYRDSTNISQQNSLDAHSGPPSARQLSSRQQSRSGSSMAGSRPGTSSMPEPMEELHLQCQEYKLLSQAATVERDKLSELVQLLQARLDAAQGQATDAHGELIAQRRKNAHLEKQLGKARIDQAQSGQKGRNNTTKTSATIRDSLEFGGDSMMNMEELQVSLEIQQDENEALKAVLQRTLVAKEEDKQLYSEMLEETKRVFLQGLRQYKQRQVMS